MVRLLYIVVLIGVATVLMLSVDVKVTFVVLAAMPLIAIFASVVSLKMRPIWMQTQEMQGQISTVLQESLTGMRVVKAFSREEHEQEKFDAKAEGLFKYSYRGSLIMAFSEPAMISLWLLAAAIVFWVGGREVAAGAMTTGDLAAFQLYLALLQLPVRTVGMIVNMFARAHASGTRVYEILDAESAVRLLRKLRGVEENSIKAARKAVHVDSLVDRGISHDAPDDRMVKNPKRKVLQKKARGLERTISSFDVLPESALTPYPEALMLAELQSMTTKLELREQPSKLPRIALDPDARRAWLKTRNRGLLQALKYAADNSRRWLLLRLGRSLAPTDHDYDATALPRTLDALLKSPGHVRFEPQRLVVTFDIQFPPTAHARLDEALRALSGLRMPLHDDHRVLSFRLAPRPTRQTLPHVTQAAHAIATAP